MQYPVVNTADFSRQLGAFGAWCCKEKKPQLRSVRCLISNQLQKKINKKSYSYIHILIFMLHCKISFLHVTKQHLDSLAAFSNKNPSAVFYPSRVWNEQQQEEEGASQANDAYGFLRLIHTARACLY